MAMSLAQDILARIRSSRLWSAGVVSAQAFSTGLQVSVPAGAAFMMLRPASRQVPPAIVLTCGLNSMPIGMSLGVLGALWQLARTNTSVEAARICSSRREIDTLLQPYVGALLGSLLYRVRTPILSRAFLVALPAARGRQPIPGGSDPPYWWRTQGVAVGISASLFLRIGRWTEEHVRSKFGLKEA